MKKSTVKKVLVMILILSGYMLPATAQAQLGHYPADLLFEGNYMMYRAYEKGGDVFKQIFKVEINPGNMYQFQPDETFEVTSYGAIKNLESTLHFTANGSSYPAFRVIYGLKPNETNGYKVVYIYVPLVMKWKASGHYIDTFESDVAIGSAAEATRFYILQGGSFIPDQDTAKINQWIRNYQQYIRIYDNAINAFRPHNGLDSIDGDGKSETFAFGEIDHFFNTPGNIYITSWASPAFNHGLTTYKHFVAFANAPYHSVNEETTLAADLGTMCPPNCMVTKINAGRIQASKKDFEKHFNKSAEQPVKDKKIIWILVILGSVLVGFISSRLLKNNQ